MTEAALILLHQPMKDYFAAYNREAVSIIPKSVHVERMEQNIDIWDFELTEEEMTKVAAKDLGHSEIVNHDDPGFVKMLMTLH